MGRQRTGQHRSRSRRLRTRDAPLPPAVVARRDGALGDRRPREAATREKRRPERRAGCELVVGRGRGRGLLFWGGMPATPAHAAPKKKASPPTTTWLRSRCSDDCRRAPPARTRITLVGEAAQKGPGRHPPACRCPGASRDARGDLDGATTARMALPSTPRDVGPMGEAFFGVACQHRSRSRRLRTRDAPLPPAVVARRDGA